MKYQCLIFVAVLLLCAYGRADANAENENYIKLDLGKAKFNALLQTWSLNDTTSTTDNFNNRIRRTELKFSGSVTSGTRWFVMFDPAKSLKAGPVATTNDNKVLQDLGVAFSITPELEVMAGQFKIPTTAEGLEPSGELWQPERSLSARTFGDKREPGIMVAYKQTDWKAMLMASNGQATNTDDVNNNKDLHGRVEVTPIKDLQLGAFGTLGDSTIDAKNRWGANVKYSLEDLTLKAEGVRAFDAGILSQGWSTEASYTMSEHLQPTLRFAGLDNSVVTGHEYAACMAYNLFKYNSRILLAYSYLDNLAGNNGSPTLAASGVNGSLVTAEFQAAF